MSNRERRVGTLADLGLRAEVVDRASAETHVDAFISLARDGGAVPELDRDLWMAEQFGGYDLTGRFERSQWVPDPVTGAPVALLCAYERPAIDGFVTAPSVTLTMFCVDPAWRGRGVGAALIWSVLSHNAAMGMVERAEGWPLRFTGSVVAGRERLLPFYATFGFAPLGTYHATPDHPEATLLVTGPWDQPTV